jgi:hypothetical protein
VHTWGVGGSTAMTLNSTGLGVGVAGGSIAARMHVKAGSFQTPLIVDSLGYYQINMQLNGVSRGQIFADATNCFAVQDSTNSFTRFSVTDSGNVGVGVTPKTWSTIAPALQIGSAGAFLASQGSTEGSYLGSNVAYYSGSFNYVINGFATFYRQQNGVHSWHNAASGVANNAATFTQAMTLDASGNLLVGTTSASNQERLNLTSNRNVYIGRFFNSASSGGNYGFLINYSAAAPNNASNEFLACSDNAASRLFLYSNGGIANYQANDSNLSDIRTKTDIKPLASYWNKIKALELVTFKYKDQTHNDDNIGLIAQQVESVAPEFIDADGFGETPDDGVPIKTIYTTDLYHASIKALQEAMARIEALEAKLA